MSIKHAMTFVGIRKFVTNKRERRHFINLCIKNQSVWHTHVARVHPLTALRLAIPVMRYSIRQRGELHLGTKVTYQGNEWFVSNGTCNPSWDIRRCDDRAVSARVHENELEIVRTVRNLMHNATFIYGWWSESWSSMDIHDVTEDRMPASLRILGKRSPLYGSRLMEVDR